MNLLEPKPPDPSPLVVYFLYWNLPYGSLPQNCHNLIEFHGLVACPDALYSLWNLPYSSLSKYCQKFSEFYALVTRPDLSIVVRSGSSRCESDAIHEPWCLLTLSRDSQPASAKGSANLAVKIVNLDLFSVPTITVFHRFRVWLVLVTEQFRGVTEQFRRGLGPELSQSVVLVTSCSILPQSRYASFPSFFSFLCCNFCWIFCEFPLYAIVRSDYMMYYYDLLGYVSDFVFLSTPNGLWESRLAHDLLLSCWVILLPDTQTLFKPTTNVYVASLYDFAVWQLDSWLWDCLRVFGMRNVVPSIWLLPWRLLMDWYSTESYILTDMNGALNFQCLVYLLLFLRLSSVYFCWGKLCLSDYYSWCCWYCFVWLIAVFLYYPTLLDWSLRMVHFPLMMYVNLVDFHLWSSDMLIHFTWRLWFVLVFRLSFAGTLLRFPSLGNALPPPFSVGIWWKGFLSSSPYSHPLGMRHCLLIVPNQHQKVLGHVAPDRCRGQIRLDVYIRSSSVHGNSVVSVQFSLSYHFLMYWSFDVMIIFSSQMAFQVMVVVSRVQCIVSHPVNCIFGCCTPSVINCNSRCIRILEQHFRVLGLCLMALDVHPWMLSPAHYGCCSIRYSALLQFFRSYVAMQVGRCVLPPPLTGCMDFFLASL